MEKKIEKRITVKQWFGVGVFIILYNTACLEKPEFPPKGSKKAKYFPTGTGDFLTRKWKIRLL